MSIEDNIDIAFRNSYDVIINDEDATQLITKDSGYFIHHPAKPITINILKNMTDYFSEIEEYEKCIKILKYINDEQIQ